MTDEIGTNYRAHLDDLTFGRPHVFILGAGASRAAFPDGDAGGRQLPLMNDLVEKLGFDHDLALHGLRPPGNFEELYATISSEGKYADLVNVIESRVQAYFEDLRLPKTATLYDRLVLSLRGKDVIATFNWDPFLFDACARNAHTGVLPHTFFLHGNVRVGYCAEHRNAGEWFARCTDCGERFQRSRLLFPVTKKNYQEDPYIGAQWRNLKSALKDAYMLTIFGYSAPQSDTEAVTLMKEGWGQPAERNLEEIEIIDIKPREELEKMWSPFIHTHHFRTYVRWCESWAANYPRRTCEAMWSTLMENNPRPPSPLPGDRTLDGLWTWLRPLCDAEPKLAPLR